MTAEEAIKQIRVLLTDETTHARNNLWGAVQDIERYCDNDKPVDEVCLRTIYRVMGQLGKVETILKSVE